MFIYTGSFFNKTFPADSVCISISRSDPNIFYGPRYPTLAPSASLLSHWKQHKDVAYYTAQFNSYLSSLDWKTVVNHLKQIAQQHNVSNVVLCCWEPDNQFCHRHLVKAWLQQQRKLELTSILEIKGFRDQFSFLSNFYPAPVQLAGVIYPTVEHAYQAAKTLNPQQRQQFTSGTPGEAKRLGQHISLRPDWDKAKLNIMKDLLQQKFKHPDLADKLKATGSAYLEETNTWRDTYWGVCNNQGSNHLGKLLMAIRETL